MRRLLQLLEKRWKGLAKARPVGLKEVENRPQEAWAGLRKASRLWWGHVQLAQQHQY